jgi:8-oxo-dGTP pyrophosphatase MutT (NUDIX family)
LEHTPNRDLAMEIAMDHLAEDPRYYQKLALIDPHHNPRAARHGACVIILRAGRLLAISHNHDRSNWNLPGGGLEAGESFGQAALRELQEETQVDASRATLIPVRHRRTVRGESVAFMALGDVRFPRVMRSIPFEGHVEWKRPIELLAPRCTHADTNLVTFGRLGLV